VFKTQSTHFFVKAEQIFTSWITTVSPNKQYQSTEGTRIEAECEKSTAVYWTQRMKGHTKQKAIKYSAHTRLNHTEVTEHRAQHSQRIETVVQCGVCLGFYRSDDPSVAQLVDDIDETLFATVLHNFQHVLRYISPDKCTITYCLRPGRHELTLTIKRDSRNFLETV